jgi:hypothetical protein
LPSFLGELFKPEEQNKKWKMVEMIDQETGHKITELIDADIVNDMAI